jgi:hypothetical protein
MSGRYANSLCLECYLIAYSHPPKKPSLHLVGDIEFAILIQNCHAQVAASGFGVLKSQRPFDQNFAYKPFLLDI